MRLVLLHLSQPLLVLSQNLLNVPESRKKHGAQFRDKAHKYNGLLRGYERQLHNPLQIISKLSEKKYVRSRP